MLTLSEMNIHVSTQDFPGKDHDMPKPKPDFTKLPEVDGFKTTYKAAGELKSKKALITGGDSRIGAGAIILFAMEGADSAIAYLAEEGKDAQGSKKRVKEMGAKCHLIARDLAKKENCKEVMRFAMKEMGAVDIMFNNAACK